MYKWLFCLSLLPGTVYAQSDTARNLGTLERALYKGMHLNERLDSCAMFAGLVVTMKRNSIDFKWHSPVIKNMPEGIQNVVSKADWPAIFPDAAKHKTYKVLIPFTWGFKGQECYDTLSYVAVRRMTSGLERQLRRGKGAYYVMRSLDIVSVTHVISCYSIKTE